MIPTKLMLVVVVVLAMVVFVKAQVEGAVSSISPAQRGSLVKNGRTATGDVFGVAVPESASRGIVGKWLTRANKFFVMAEASNTGSVGLAEILENYITARTLLQSALSMAKQLDVRAESAARIDVKRLQSGIQDGILRVETMIRGGGTKVLENMAADAAETDPLDPFEDSDDDDSDHSTDA